jgi:hypothetical protein
MTATNDSRPPSSRSCSSTLGADHPGPGNNPGAIDSIRRGMKDLDVGALLAVVEEER